MNKEIGKTALIFVHIPKAAGTTLHKILLDQYDADEHFYFAGTSDIERFLALSDEQRGNIGVLRGHMPYGMDTFLPRPAKYITILRDPIDRVISSYYYAQRDPSCYINKFVSPGDEIPKDFIFTTVENDNFQTRILARAEGMNIPFGECSQDLLEVAKENLRNCGVAGISERYDETLLLMKRTLGWKHPPCYVKQNVTSDRPRKNDVPRETIELIEKYNQLDKELYRYASELFDKRIKQQDSSFEVELQYFRLANKQYEKHQQLLIQHQQLQQTKAVVISRKLSEFPWLMKLASAGYTVLARISRLFRKR